MSEQLRKFPNISFRPGKMKEELDARSSAGTSADMVAKRDLERYYYMLTLVLNKISFTEGEAIMLCNSLNGAIVQPYTVSLLWAHVSDAIKEGYAGNGEVDGPALVEKLRSLTPFECMAVSDAIERFWSGDSYHINNTAEKLKAVGLVK